MFVIFGTKEELSIIKSKFRKSSCNYCNVNIKVMILKKSWWTCVGKKIGKVAALFPVMYLAGGTCVTFIITGGGTMQQFYHTICPKDTCHGHPLGSVEWFLVFTCIAILIAQLPNLNSIAGVSLVGAIAAVSYCTLFWVLSVKKGRPAQVSYSPSLAEDGDSAVAKIAAAMNAVGTVVFAFRGHNVLLEIQASFLLLRSYTYLFFLFEFFVGRLTFSIVLCS